MTARNSQTNGASGADGGRAADRRTSLSVRAARGQIVLAAITDDPRVQTVDDARRRFPTWHDAIFNAAIDDLVADGRLTQDAHGRLRTEDRR